MSATPAAEILRNPLRVPTSTRPWLSKASEYGSKLVFDVHIRLPVLEIFLTVWLYPTKMFPLASVAKAVTSAKAFPTVVLKVVSREPGPCAHTRVGVRKTFMMARARTPINKVPQNWPARRFMLQPRKGASVGQPPPEFSTNSPNYFRVPVDK